MEDQTQSDTGHHNTSSTSHIFKKFQILYAKQLKEADDTSDGLKLKIKILENWVEDLTEQNVMLVKTVDELESEALKRLSMLEKNITQNQEVTQDSTAGRNTYFGKGLNSQIETLCRELEQVKKQLSDKEQLLSKYQSRFEELGSTIEGEKGDDCSKVLAQYFSKAENLCDQDRNVLPSVYRELETARLQVSQVEKEVIQLKKKLKEAESNTKRLRSDLVASEKNAREMRAALTAEVAEKHDQILALRREVAQLEEQLRQADMQTHFKDDIIKELRKEVKVARSKETLVEVLGIKERSLSHMEHLTEQLEQKDQVISCLQQQLTQGSADLLYRVRQQVDWFTENVTQQCSQGNCSEEFQKRITTMLEELKESIECCNLVPSEPAELNKDSVNFVSALQKNLEKSKKDLCQSWKSISDTVHEMNEMDLSPMVEQWKKGLCKQRSLQQKLQEIVRSIINITSCSNINVESITKSMDSLQCLLFRFTDELNSQPRGRSFTGWLKNLHSVVTELISKIQEITQIISDIKSSDDESHADLVSKMQQVDSLQWELNEALRCELKAYEQLCCKEKAQRIRVDSLLATVLHHQEIWNQQITLTDDLMKEILRLSNNLVQNPKLTLCDDIQIPMKERSIHLQTLVSKISADIRKSLCDIEQRQNQVSHLELDLSSVKMVLESAQHEIDEISKTYNTQDMRQKVTCLLLKLKKQISNALTKANNLVEAYANTKQQYTSSSERILQLQKEWDVLEKEVRDHWAKLTKDFKKPQKTARSLCPTQEVLETYQRKCSGRQLASQYRCVEKTLQKEGAALKKVKGNVMDLKSNIKDRDKLTETQDKTICVLQNSLKICQNEADQLRQTVHRLEVEKCEIEIDGKKKIKDLECKVSKLQNCLKKYEEVHKNHLKTEEALKLVIANLKENISKEQKKFDDLQKNNKLLEKQLENCKTSNPDQDKTIDSLQNALKTSQEELRKLCKKLKCLELEKAETEKELKDQIETLKKKIKDLQNNLKSGEDTSTKYHKSEAALQIVIANLKETIYKERKKHSDVEKENCLLRERVKELEDCNKNTSKSNVETQDQLNDLQKQIKCLSKRACDLEEQVKTNQEKLCKSLQREKELEKELSSKESKYVEDICKKQQEINELTNAVQSLTERLNESKTELDSTRRKTCDVEIKLQSICSAYEELKVKEREKEAHSEKLQVALTQLSNKFVSRRLDTGTSRHYQEECAKYEALYNTTACKLRSKEMEISALKQEVERLRSELDNVAMTMSQQKEEETCPFLLERVHQLTKELQVAHSCQNSYESLLKDLRDKYSKKEEETYQLKAQIKQVTLQRDAILSDLNQSQQEINRLKVSNSNLQSTINRLEQNNAQVSEQLHRAVYDSEHSTGSHVDARMQPNIELQREISTALTSQLRSVKQKLHATKHDYKLLQAAYEELNRKYMTLQRGERDLEQTKEIKLASKPESRCRPCMAKSSKSVTYIKMPEGSGQDRLEYLSHSKSWHKMENAKELDWKERRWKRRLQEVIRGDLDPSEAMHHSSSSN